MFLIATTRFNNDTWNENANFRKKNNYNGCIYGTPAGLSSKIDKDVVLFVIEMNNTTNKIEGIGVIKNTLRRDKYYKIYDVGNFNRYTYTGKYRIDRDELSVINNDLVNFLDKVLFKGKTHSKRGDSISLFPKRVMCETFEEMDIKQEIKTIFMRKFRNEDEM